MASMRAIRNRIKSVESTRQITKSMKMVAASKLRKTQAAGASLRTFAEKSGEMLSAVMAGGVTGENPYLQPRDAVKKVCYVLFVGNRGLCGMYNNAVLKHMTRLAQENTTPCFAVVCGRWGRENIANTGIEVRRTFDQISDAPSSAEAREVGDYLRDLYLSGEADKIVLVYEHYKSVLSQIPADTVLFPVEPAVTGDTVPDYIFEPDAESLINSLVDLYIDNTVYSVLLEAKTGEHSARMTAMTAATDNTDELIAKLNLSLNHARQAAITTEISEIVGGASALYGN